MKNIEFTKMVASGNDFVILETSNQKPVTRNFSYLAKKICNRKYGIGADGVLLIGKSKIADVRMRIFNADGSEAEMCGNGARCIALYSASNQKPVTSNQKKIKIETRAGIIESEVSGDNVRIKLTDPSDVKLDIPIRIASRLLKVDFINTGVPHAVIFVEGLEKLDVAGLGRQIRNHAYFAPHGANVNFVELSGNDSISIRTYERGVENETLACGTGSVASALITAYQSTRAPAHQKINVKTQGGEILKIYFDKINSGFKNVWLAGKAGIVFSGKFIL